MPVSVIPVDLSTGNYSERVQLGAVAFELSIRYNARMDRWIMDIADSNGVPIIQGQPILVDWPVAGRFRFTLPGMPANAIVALDITGADQDPTGATLGGNVPLMYLEP